MIDIDRLRQLAQAINEHSDDRAEILAEFYAATQSDIIIELLDRLEASEKSDAESLTLYRKARDECDALRAKIVEIERQEPVATVIKEGDSRYWMSERLWTFPDGKYPLYALPGAQQCKNCNGMGDRFDPSGEKIPCDLCESHLEEIRSLVAEAAHDIISGSDFWLSISLAAKKIYALPGTQNVPKEAIAKILTEVMDIATSNGADSRSMPDEYVEVAAWLCGIPTHTPRPACRKTISV
jgi:hypothetical protein